jgi:hypothetical protein
MMHRRDCLSSLILLHQQSFPLAFPTSTLAYDDKRNETVSAAQKIAAVIQQQQEVQDSSSNVVITLPLERCSGGTNCVRVTISYDPIASRFDSSLLYVPTKVFKLAVDTGSPYLVISDGFEFASYVEEVYSSSSRDDNDDDEKKDFENIGNKNKFYNKKNNNVLQKNIAFSMAIKQLSFLLEPEMNFKLTQDSGYPPTTDIYGSQSGTIAWRKSQVRTTSIHGLSKNIVFGILDENLAQESGGSLFGLIKHVNDDPRSTQDKVQLRPTLLQQLSTNNDSGDSERRNTNGGGEGAIASFAIDSPNRLLILSTKSLLLGEKEVVADDTVMPLVDLRLYGDFVDHYAVQVLSLEFGNGKIITGSDISQRMGSSGTTRTAHERPIVAVLDTGLTGCLISNDLWQLLLDKEEKQEDSLSISVKTVQLMPSNHHGNDDKDSTSSSCAPFVFHAKYNPSDNPFFNLGPIKLDWFDNEETCPFVIVLGQAFLNQGKLTIDIEDRRARFSSTTVLASSGMS